jgi:sulfur carrier protein ThiS
MSSLLRFSGHLKEFTGGRAEIAVEPGRSIRAALTEIGVRPETVALVVVNEAHSDKDYILQDGDVVRIIAVIGGG